MNQINMYANHSFNHFIDKELNRAKTLLILQKNIYC